MVRGGYEYDKAYTYDVQNSTCFSSFHQIDLGIRMSKSSLCSWRDKERSTEIVAQDCCADIELGTCQSWKLLRGLTSGYFQHRQHLAAHAALI